MKCTPVVTELQEQIALFQWAELRPDLRLMHHIPNGGRRDKRTAALMKKQGVKSGVPDIFLPKPVGRYHGLYIELKRADGGKTSENQEEWLRELRAEGYRCEVCHGWIAAAETIKHYLEGL